MAISDRRLLGSDPVSAIAAQLTRWAELGPRLILQIREKDLPAPELIAWLDALAPKAAAIGAHLVVNGRADVARCCRGVGVHLPAAGIAPAAARRLLGPDVLIGASTHDLTELRAAAGADYATISPIFATPGKGRPIGLSGLRAAAGLRADDLRLLALGGIGAGDLPALWEAGADGVAAIRAAWDPAGGLAAVLR